MKARLATLIVVPQGRRSCNSALSSPGDRVPSCFMIPPALAVDPLSVSFFPPGGYPDCVRVRRSNPMSPDPRVTLVPRDPAIVAGDPNPVSVWSLHYHFCRWRRWTDPDAESDIELGECGRGEKEHSAKDWNPNSAFHSWMMILLTFTSRTGEGGFRIRCAPMILF